MKVEVTREEYIGRTNAWLKLIKYGSVYRVVFLHDVGKHPWKLTSDIEDLQTAHRKFEEYRDRFKEAGKIADATVDTPS